MIKSRFRSEKNGNSLILGLSKENVTRLQDDKPISFDLLELGLPQCRVFILYGETEDSIKQHLVNTGVIPENL